MNYYGVRYAKNCHPSDLWVKYFTSSKRVAKYIKTHGAPDVIQIRQIFVSNNKVEAARRWEHKVLKRLNVIARNDFLNASDSKSIDPAASSKARTGVAPGNKGMPQPEYIKDKKRKPKPLATCPHCGITGGISVMSRWHFAKCGSDINNKSNTKIAQTNRQKRLRPVVTIINEIRKSLNKEQLQNINAMLGIKSGWYQFATNRLELILIEHQKLICRL